MIKAQTSKALFVQEVAVESKFWIWHTHVVDTAWINSWLSSGVPVRKADGSYCMWLTDTTGNAIEIKRIMMLVPLFFDNPPPHIEYKGEFIKWEDGRGYFYDFNAGAN